MPAGSEEKKDQLAGDYERIAKEYGEGLRNKYAIVTGGNSGPSLNVIYVYQAFMLANMGLLVNVSSLPSRPQYSSVDIQGFASLLP